ncbi:MAG: hypothetical protein KC535_01710 [Nanoarchaeota archaeon]|nr:hypothetical protein [Nanoarchaeota archaeon]
MAKTFSKCKLCSAPKFLNFAGLCKRCNKTKEGLEILEKAIAEQEELQAIKDEAHHQEELEHEAEEKAKQEAASDGKEAKEEKESKES